MPQKFFPGWQKSKPDPRDALFAYRPRAHFLRTMPSSINIAKPSPGKMFENIAQGDLGACGPNSVAENIVYDETLTPAVDVMPSRLFVYYNTRALMGTTGQDSGVDNRTMLKALAAYGWCDEALCPYDTSRFTQKPSAAAYSDAKTRMPPIIYQSVAQDLATMKACLVETRRPILFGFNVYSSMLTPAVDATGDVPNPRAGDTMEGGHDVEIVGYDDATGRFIFKNHWNESGFVWGNGGYGTISYAFATNPNLAGDFWTVTQVELPVPTPGPAPVAPTLKDMIDLGFEKLYAILWFFPPVVAILKQIQAKIDALLGNTASMSYSVGMTVPPAVVTVINNIFAWAEGKWPQYAMLLEIVKGVLMGVLGA